jgi:hypothetical protein
VRATVIRRTAVAASAVSLALLATACGGSESGDKAKAKETAAAKPVAKALTAAELEKLALAEGDVKDHKVGKAGPGEVIAADDVTVDKAACEPIAYALSAVPVGEPAATVQRKVTSEAKKGKDVSFEDLAEMTEEEVEKAMTSAFDVTMTMTALSSYDGKGAEQAFTGLRTAATDCAGGFTLTTGSKKQKVTKISDESVSGGEDALAWTVTAEQDGEKAPLKVVVVRQGTTLASFSSVNLAAVGTGGDYELPTAVVEAQVAKLG